MRVNEKYKAIYTALLEEKPLYERRIEKAEEEIEAQKSEILSLRVIHREAERSRSSSETELRNIKKVAKESQINREKELVPLKERFRRDVERQEKDLKSLGFGNEIHFSGTTSTLVQDMDRNYAAAFEKLKSVTGKATTKEIEEHLLNQHQIRKELEMRSTEMKIKLLELEKLKTSFEQELDLHIFNSETSNGNFEIEQEIETKEKELEEISDKIAGFKSRLSFVTPLLTDIRSVAENIYNTLKIEGDGDTTINGISTLEIINLCEQRLEKRMKEISDNNFSMEFEIIEKEDEDLGYSTCSSIIPARRKIREYSSEDSDDEDKPINREQLKKQALMLAEKKSKQKSTKRQLLKL